MSEKNYTSESMRLAPSQNKSNIEGTVNLVPGSLTKQQDSIPPQPSHTIRLDITQATTGMMHTSTVMAPVSTHLEKSSGHDSLYTSETLRLGMTQNIASREGPVPTPAVVFSSSTEVRMPQSGEIYTHGNDSMRLPAPQNTHNRIGAVNTSIAGVPFGTDTQKPPAKISSFTITSIRPSSRSSNDADTFDEVETDTEDTSDILDCSRATAETESPGYTEDPNGNGIPASQPPHSVNSFNLATFVHPDMSEIMPFTVIPQGITVDVADGELAYAKSADNLNDIDNWQKRFKIVKISSKEKFRRGRWVCYDFGDSFTDMNKNNSDNNRIKEMESAPVTVVQGMAMASKVEDGNIMQAAVVLTQAVLPNAAPIVVDVDIQQRRTADCQTTSYMSVHDISQPNTGIAMNMTTVVNHTHASGVPPSQESQMATTIQQQVIQSGMAMHGVPANYDTQGTLNLVSTPSAATHMMPQSMSNQQSNHGPPIISPVPTTNSMLPPQHTTPLPMSSQPGLPLPASSITAMGPISQPNYSYSNPATSFGTANSLSSQAKATTVTSISIPSTGIRMSLGPGEPDFEVSTSELQALKTLHAHVPEDGESASTSSSVAIDNKIEQAMDLVKSHLMFAVREEVEVLKEKIGELMEKINSLECENNVLRQYAPPDALLQLQQAPQQQTLPSNLPHHTSS